MRFANLLAALPAIDNGYAPAAFLAVVALVLLKRQGWL
jgi:hypothetical protein